ncbi:MAG: pyridoxamine 5'-phosphate oxidase family protein [Nitrososphaera sp.]|nr:pyridoxamine 5'-phosphate oxidase family protein [Nitrososphaera sp.]
MDYRLADKTASPLEQDELLALLNQTNILRLAVIDARDGLPLVHPVWYYYEDGRFFVSSDGDGVKARSIRKNPNVYFLLDVDPENGPPYGVRGKGTARVVDDAEYASKVTVRNILRYLGTLDGQVAQSLIEMGKDSCVIEITPHFMATWKY